MPIHQLFFAISSSTTLPAAYQTLINTFGGTVRYVDPTGSNGNSGTEASPWADPLYAINTGASSGDMIVIKPGTYILSSVIFDFSSISRYIFSDANKDLEIVCYPGQVKIIGPTTDPGSRDYHHIHLQNSNSHLYGGIIYRNNNNRANNYSNAIFGYPRTSGNTGTVSNTFFKETNANGRYSIHYDNPNTHNWTANNCSFNGSTWQSNYSGGSSTTVNFCAGSGSWTTSGTKNNPQTNSTFNSDFSTTVSNTTYGVYSGTYAWDSASVTQTL